MNMVKESFSTMDSVTFYLLWWVLFLFLGDISRSTIFLLYKGHRILTFLIEQHMATLLGTTLALLHSGWELFFWSLLMNIFTNNSWKSSDTPSVTDCSFSCFKSIIWKEKVCLELSWEQRSVSAGGDLSGSLGVHLSSDYLFPPPSLSPSLTCSSL